MMRCRIFIRTALAGAVAAIAVGAHAQPQERPTSYMPLDLTESFDSVLSRMRAAKAGVEKKHATLLAERYDLANRALPGAKMTKGKAVQSA